MGLDDFKPDNPLKEDPPEATKWRYEEPEMPIWERHVISEEEIKEDSNDVMVLRISTADVSFVTHTKKAWLSSELYVSLSEYR